MDVAADGRRVVAGPFVEPDEADDLAENSSAVQAARLDHRNGVDKLLSTDPGAQVTDLDLGYDDGRLEWDAEIIDGQQAQRSITIDAVSGQVLRNEFDD